MDGQDASAKRDVVMGTREGNWNFSVIGAGSLIVGLSFLPSLPVL